MRLTKIKPWIASGLVHLAFFSVVLAITSLSILPRASQPARLYSAKVDIKTPVEELLEPIRSSLFHNEPIQPEIEIIPAREPEPEPLPLPDFTPDKPIKEHIPDTISILMPSTDTRPKRFVRLDKIKRSLQNKTTAEVYIPAKPVDDDVRNKLPDYPSKSRELGQEGLVVLSVEITPDGAVEKVEVITSSGYLLLDEAAIKSVRGWRFSPAQVNGRPVTSTIKIPIRFRLE